MQQSQAPDKFPIPFANGAGQSYVRTIPQGSQIGIANGAASLQDGFPPLNFTPVGSGGVPPFGQDMNGILRQITQWARWQAAGALNLWDGTFATAIGGYPRGALLSSTTAGLAWLNTVDNNLTNPDGGTAAGWQPVLTGASVPQTSLIHAGADTSTTAGVITIPILSPPLSSLGNFLVLEIVPALPINGPTTVGIQTFGAVPLKRSDGSDLRAGDGPAGQPFLAAFLNGVLRRLDASPSEVAAGQWHYGVDTGQPGAIVANVSPDIPGYVEGCAYHIRVANSAISSGTTANLDGRGARTVTRADGTPVRQGDYLAGQVVVMIDDGTRLQIAGLVTSNLPASASVLFTQTTTLTPPAGVQRAFVQVWGAGGGGGGAGNNAAGNGGGPGGYAEGYVDVVPGVPITVTIGAGGSAGSAGGGNGGGGGTSSFGSLVSATGGAGGLGSPSGIIAASAAAGQGFGGSFQWQGVGGQFGYMAGPAYFGGTNGAGYQSSINPPGSNSPGGPGAGAGSGGSGASTNAVGGAGAAGQVRVTY